YSSNCSTFPGRRVGGGTRGECSARILVHLVPENSVFAPGATGILGLVQGPATNPVSLELSFQPEGVGSATTRTLPAASASLTLISGVDITVPTIWESTFNCETGDGVDNLQDPLSFVQTTFPPVLSLLVPDAEPVDQPVQLALASLRAKCGGTVPSVQTLAKFGLADLVTDEWPQQLPVRCPS
ncbi:MAG: hypothetical protein VKI93_08535, partial [Synechococcus sp.]|nr:hypothetical protein [Synechococcus sp.]